MVYSPFRDAMTGRSCIQSSAGEPGFCRLLLPDAQAKLATLVTHFPLVRFPGITRDRMVILPAPPSLFQKKSKGNQPPSQAPKSLCTSMITHLVISSSHMSRKLYLLSTYFLHNPLDRPQKKLDRQGFELQRTGRLYL